MQGVIFYFRSSDDSSLETQRHICRKLAGRDAKVLAEFRDDHDSSEKLLEALDYSSRVGATFISVPVH
jgi:flagellar biosynthesis regulator FlaF